jgi:5'-nucleotidase
MFDRPIDLGRARILLTNDDGIEARGLKVLHRVVRGLCRDVWIVAPEIEQSGASHSLTLHRPLRVRKLGPRRFAVDGTPTDCVLLALKRLLGDKQPTLVVSGINGGANLGDDVTYSGTVAAAMEATLLGVPAIRWPTAERHAPEVIRRLVAQPWPKNTLINVNFPDLPPSDVKGITVARQGRHKIGDQLMERTDPRGRPYYWIGPLRETGDGVAGTDITEVTAGWITLTPILLDLTSTPALTALRKVFS